MGKLEPGQIVRFKQNSRHGDWHKGDQGRVSRVLALPPQNQFALYIVSMFIDGAGEVEVWATDKDIEPWDQLSLW